MGVKTIWTPQGVFHVNLAKHTTDDPESLRMVAAQGSVSRLFRPPERPYRKSDWVVLEKADICVENASGAEALRRKNVEQFFKRINEYRELYEKTPEFREAVDSRAEKGGAILIEGKDDVLTAKECALIRDTPRVLLPEPMYREAMLKELEKQFRLRTLAGTAMEGIGMAAVTSPVVYAAATTKSRSRINTRIREIQSKERVSKPLRTELERLEGQKRMTRRQFLKTWLAAAAGVGLALLGNSIKLGSLMIGGRPVPFRVFDYPARILEEPGEIDGNREILRRLVAAREHALARGPHTFRDAIVAENTLRFLSHLGIQQPNVYFEFGVLHASMPDQLQDEERRKAELSPGQIERLSYPEIAHHVYSAQFNKKARKYEYERHKL